MKPRTVCEYCRRRHIKCIPSRGSTACKNCRTRGRECNFDGSERFLNVTFSPTAPFPTAPSNQPSTLLHLGSSQPNASQIGQEIFANYTQDDSPGDTIIAQFHTKTLSAVPKVRSAAYIDDRQERRRTSRDNLSKAINCREPADEKPRSANRNLHLSSAGQSLRGITSAEAGQSLHSITFLLNDQSNRQTHPQSPALHLLDSSEVTTGPLKRAIQDVESCPQTLTDEREAVLLRLFIEKVAPWADAWDEDRQLSRVLPNLAFNEPMILNSILATAARFDGLLKDGSTESEAAVYHSRALAMIISALDRPARTYNSALLTAVVVARLYEELDPNSDKQCCHLLGTSQILEHLTTLGKIADNGLAEATCWLHLRQAITYSITHGSPLNANLSCLRSLTTIGRKGDTAHGNHIMYLFAEVLQQYFPGSNAELHSTGDKEISKDPDDEQTWKRIADDIDHWFQTKPSSFTPLHYRAQDVTKGMPFPKLWMTSATQVMAMIHYHCCCIFLAMHSLHQSNSKASYISARMRLHHERAVSTRMATIIGLAISNPTIKTAGYLPVRMLTFCGYCIRHPLERLGTIDFLLKNPKLVPWGTQTLVDSLSEQWNDLDGLFR